MGIDDPIEAFKKQYPQEDESPAKDLALYVAKFALPGFVGDIMSTVYERFSRKAQAERARDMFDLLSNELKHVQDILTTKIDKKDLLESLQLAIRHDAEEFNDRKRDRYVKIIGNALRSEASIEDLASFIQDVEQLGERDFIALEVLNRVMNDPRDWSAHMITKLHPNAFIQRRKELAVQMAHAFGMKTDSSPTGQTFSHEEGYEACARLQGFGLAHEIPLGAREVPVGDYCFRPSKRGLLLLKLIGEDVPNWDKYFPTS